MNIELLEKVAARIEKEPRTLRVAESGFDMNYYFHACGTPSCIAGWTIHEADEPYSCMDDSPVKFAAGLLDLPEEKASELFLPSESPGKESDMLSYYQADGPQAARVIRHLIATGKVDWSILDAEAS